MQDSQRDLTAGVLRWAAGLYPPEKRAWGEAILAEVYEIDGFAPRLWWTLGGLTMALRVFLSSLLTPSGKPGTAGPVLPASAAPIPWKRVFICVALAAALLLVPGFRQGLGLVV